MRDDPVLPFPVPRNQLARATQFRSTWIVTSLRSLQTRGHYDRYVKLLPAGSRDEILHSVAGLWLPMAKARVHYDACDRLGLAVEEQLAMGQTVGEGAQATLLTTVVKVAKGAGVTPWTILPQFDRLWRRGADGGAVGIFRIGPKEARIEVVGCELLDVPYFRHAFRGVLLGVVAFFCQRGYMHEVPGRAAGEAIFKFQWA